MKNLHPVTVVVPVYGDWPSLKVCIGSLIENVDTAKHSVILVNDCGPEVNMIEANIKKIINNKDGFSYFRNKKNLGFVKTCNRAVLELDKTKNDILLLNSDTKTTKGFLDEMVAVLYSNEKYGVVSPRSNNATLATIPLRSAPQKGIDQDKSYELFKKISPKLDRATIVPVAHGFCMLIKKSLINKYGLFDEIFGKGYGEEVDFCQRIRQAGYDCLLSNRAFVFHQEARSFSLEAKTKMLEVNNKIIWKRYPNYRQSVRDYMEKAVVHESKVEYSLKTGINTRKYKDAIKKTLNKNTRVRNVIRKIKRN